MSKEENDRKKWSWLVTVVVQISMLVLLYFLIAWKEPFPPIPSYGIELGFVENVSKPKLAAKPAAKVEPEEFVEDEASEQVEQLEESTTEVAEDIIEELEEYVDEDSPVEAIEESLEPEAVQEEPVLVEDEVKPEEVEEKKEQEVIEEVSERESVNNENSSQEEDEGTDDTTVESIPTETPSLDNRALYGNNTESGAQGASLQLAGWTWDSKPNPKDNSDESGKIEYEIKVDSDGYLISIQLISSTVSPGVERFYRESIERLTFSKISESRTAAVSTGKVSFLITTK